MSERFGPTPKHARGITVALRPRPAADPAGPLLWLAQSGRWQSLGPAADGALPALPAAVIATDHLRTLARDGRDMLYSVVPLTQIGADATPPLLVAGSDVRAAAAAARRARILLLVQLAGVFIAEFVLVLGGVTLVATTPLARLGTAVRRWREGGQAFVATAADTMPREVRDLARSFAAASASLDEREAALRHATAQQELAMQEIHHRVKNNLQIIASLLSLQSARIRAPEARAEFQSARDRVRALATLHRHLYADGQLHMIDLRAFFAELCKQLFQSLDEVDGERIRLTITAPELDMSSDQAVPIALIVTETVSNAIKYAFPPGQSGRIDVTFTADPDGQATLTIADDGIGMPDTDSRAGDTPGPRGLGLQLVRGFVRQIGGTLTVTNSGGTCYRIAMKLESHRALQVAKGVARRATDTA